MPADNPPPGGQAPQRRLGQTMLVAAFIALLGLLTLLFDDLLDRRANPNRDLLSAVDSAGDGLPREVVLRGDRYGQYVAPGLINGEPVRFLLDTGASEVSVPGDLAARLGLRRGRPALASTANGIVTVYDTRLDQVVLGTIAQRDVAAHINPGMSGDTVLLGMSFIRGLELNQRDDVLRLRQY